MLGKSLVPKLALALSGVLLGIAIAFVFIYINIQVFGYLSLWRFADNWPTFIRIIVPVFLFIFVVGGSYYAVSFLPGSTGKAAILSSFLSFVASRVYAHATVETTNIGWLTSGLLIFVIGGCAVVGWKYTSGTTGLE
jgi:hypothetical protein